MLESIQGIADAVRLGSVDVLIRKRGGRVKGLNEHGLEADVGVLELR